MSNIFEALATQRRSEAQKVVIGGLIGIMAAAAIVRVVGPGSALDYGLTIIGALPGACISASIMEHQEESHLGE